jgi:DNA topoisomerase-1
MANPRDLDLPLIEAYLARRALDYLVGFNCRRCCGASCRAARARAACNRRAALICEREAEIEAFVPREYWTVQARMATPSGAPFTARLTHHEGKRLDQFDLSNEALAMAAKAAVEAASFSVGSVEKKRVKRNPPAPFQTSTCSRKPAASWASAPRSRCAPRSPSMRAWRSAARRSASSPTCGRMACRWRARRSPRSAAHQVELRRGLHPGAPREYTSRAKNAQEAHEAIRPTDVGARRRRWRATCPTSSASSTS